MSILSIDPTSVSSTEQEVVLTATISGLPSSSFFRAEWQKSPGDTYFGYSKNNANNWTKVQSDQDCTNYYSVTDINTNSLVLITKIGSDNILDNGSYSIKLRRYTGSCASSSDSDPISVQINLPTPTPTASPNPTVPPTSVPTQIPIKTQSPLPKRTTQPSPTDSTEPSVLGEAIENSNNDVGLTGLREDLYSTPSSQPESSNGKSKSPLFAILLVVFGLILVGISGYLAFLKSKVRQSES